MGGVSVWPSVLKGKAKNQLWISTVSYGTVPNTEYQLQNDITLNNNSNKTVPDLDFSISDPVSGFFHPGSRGWIFSSRIRNTELFFTQKIVSKLREIW